jgi:hypothetical protein
MGRFARLNVFAIPVPPLRRRKNDILMVVDYLVQRYATKAGKIIRHVHSAFGYRISAVLNTRQKYFEPVFVDAQALDLVFQCRPWNSKPFGSSIQARNAAAGFRKRRFNKLSFLVH